MHPHMGNMGGPNMHMNMGQNMGIVEPRLGGGPSGIGAGLGQGMGGGVGGMSLVHSINHHMGGMGMGIGPSPINNSMGQGR